MTIVAHAQPLVRPSAAPHHGPQFPQEHVAVLTTLTPPTNVE